jgi:hypothetical protein
MLVFLASSAIQLLIPECQICNLDLSAVMSIFEFQSLVLWRHVVPYAFGGVPWGIRL